MKSRLTACLTNLLVLCSLLLGFGQFQSVQAAKHEPTLKIGMEANYPPYNWTQTTATHGAAPIDGSKQFANGYDVQIAKIIGRHLHRRVVVEKTQWDGLLPALTSGKIDLIIAGMSPTSDRRKVINFSQPYRKSTFVIIVNKASKFATAKGLNDFSGARLTAQQGTLHYDLIKQLRGAKRENAMTDFSAMRQSLQSGTIDGYVAEDIEYESYHRVNKNIVAINLSRMKGFKVAESDAITSIGVKKRNTTLLRQVNRILATVSAAKRVALMNAAVRQQPRAGDSQTTQEKHENLFVKIMRQYGGMILSGVGMTLLLALVGTIVTWRICLIGIVRLK